MKFSGNKAVWISIAAFVVLGLLAIPIGMKFRTIGGCRLPEFDAAEVLLYAPGGKGITTAVDPRYFGRLRGDFEGVDIDPNPSKWVVAGEVRLLKGGKQVLLIELFSEEVVVPFRIDGNYYFPDPGEGPPELLETSYLNPP